MMKTGNIICAVNPVVGQEYEVRHQLPPKRCHQVAVIGGGPGGMQAAITAAEQGHNVTLYEASDSLGGALKFAAHESFKELLHRLSQWQIHRLQELGVRVVLNCTVTREMLSNMQVEDVICAVGAHPITPDQFGIPGDNYVLATNLFEDGVTIGDQVVMMGGGLVGCETALHLAEHGKHVTVIETAEDIAVETTPAHRRAMKVRMGLFPEMAGGDQVKASLVPPVLQTSTRCLEITEQGVVAQLPSGEIKLFPADTVICALGLRANRDAAGSLRLPQHNFISIGDCRSPRQVTQAIREGFDAAMSFE